MTARLSVCCSTSELTSLMTSGQKPCSEQTEQNHFECPECRWTDDINAFNPKRRRWESNPLNAALQAAATPCDVSVIQSVPLPGVEPDLQPSQSCVHPPHSKDKIVLLSQRENDVRREIIRDRAPKIPHRGIEPRPTASKAAMHPPHPQGIFIQDN